MKNKRTVSGKQLFPMLFIACLLIFISGHTLLAGPKDKSIEKITGEFTCRYDDNESIDQSLETCKQMAMKVALESALASLRSRMEIDDDRLGRIYAGAIDKGYLKNFKVLESSTKDNMVYCRIQADIDREGLERFAVEFIENCFRLRPQQAYRIAFYKAEVQEGLAYAKDDVSPAPDSSIRVVDQHGNTIFHSGQKFAELKMYARVLQNRNNYKPDFEGISFRYTFPDSSACLDVQLLDYDGIEMQRSDDDVIGSPYRIAPASGQRIGKQWIESNGWKMEIEIIECENTGNHAAMQ